MVKDEMNRPGRAPGRRNFTDDGVTVSNNSYSTNREILAQRFCQIPEELQRQNRWVLFRLVYNKDHPEKDPKKIPINPRNLEVASCSDSATWGSFAQCVELFKGGEGDAIGFSLCPPYVGLDLDKCYEDGDLNEFARGLVEEIDSYTETSLRGRGIHILIKGHLSKSIATKGFEVYQTGRFFIYTGDHYPGTPLEILERQSYLDTLPKAHTYNGDARNGEKVLEGNRNNYLTHIAGVMRRAGMGLEALRAALLAQNKSRCEPPLEEQEVLRIAQSISRYPPENTTPEAPDHLYESPPLEVYEQAPAWEEGKEEPQVTEIPSNDPDGIGEEATAWEIPRCLIDDAPGVLGAYVDWYLSCARNPEPVYALASGIAFITAAVGTRRHLYDAFLNTGVLAIGPTQSGKESEKRFLRVALTELMKRVGPEAVSIKRLENDFASGPAVWWTVHDHGATMLFHTELGKAIAGGSKSGTMAYETLTALMQIHDAIMYEQVVPTRYSERVKKNVRKMLPIDNPFLALHGTGTPRFYREARAMAGEDGSLNRLLIFNCEGTAKERATERITPLPEEIMIFFKGFDHAMREMEYEDEAEEYRLERAQAVIDKVRRAPGTWGRYGLKSTRLALMACICRGGAYVTTEDMVWACDVVEHASDIATKKFEQYGGLADSATDSLEKAIMAMFDSPAVRRNEGNLTRYILATYCRRWREADVILREKVLAHMEKGRFLLSGEHGWKKGVL